MTAVRVAFVVEDFDERVFWSGSTRLTVIRFHFDQLHAVASVWLAPLITDVGPHPAIPAAADVIDAPAVRFLGYNDAVSRFRVLRVFFIEVTHVFGVVW